MTWSLGIATGACPQRPVLDVWEAVERSGALGVELGTPPRHFDPWKEADVCALSARVREGAARIVSIHAPFGGLLDLADPNPYHRYAAIGAILAAGRAIKRLGGSVIVVHPSDRPRDGADIQEGLEHCRDSLRSLGASCRQEGLHLVVESPLPHLVGGAVDEFAWVLGQLEESIGVCLDTGHTALGHAWPAFLAATQDRLRHVHASDNHYQHDDHLPPGEGALDWRAIADSLRAAQYHGWIMLELRCPPGDLAEYFHSALQRAHGLLSP